MPLILDVRSSSSPPITTRACRRAGPNFLGTPWARMGTVPIRAHGWPDHSSSDLRITGQKAVVGTEAQPPSRPYALGQSLALSYVHLPLAWSRGHFRLSAAGRVLWPRGCGRGNLTLAGAQCRVPLYPGSGRSPTDNGGCRSSDRRHCRLTHHADPKRIPAMSCRTRPRSQAAVHLRHPASFCRSAR